MVGEVGHVRELVRYPVKSMAGTATESAFLGWRGLDGDRRFAFRRSGDDSGFPWLTASRVPELIVYHPVGLDESTGEPLATHVLTPAGTRLELRSVELESEVAGRFGGSVELMRLKHGIFDETPVSVISLTTIAGIGEKAGVDLDPGVSGRMLCSRLATTNLFSRMDGLAENWCSETPTQDQPWP